MDDGSGLRPLRALRAGLHLLVATLLTVVVARAVTGDPDVAAAMAAVATGAVYAAGARWATGGPRGAAIPWLAGLCGAWLALVALTPDGVWLAFPLFVLQLLVLPSRAGLAAVAATTACAVAGFAAHAGAFAPAAAIGPVLGAAVAVATVRGYQALHRESEQRRRLIAELTATRGELAAAGHAAGVAAERERLAREIHDTLAQGLTSIQLLLRAAERALPADAPGTAPAAAHVAQARQTALENLAEARRFVRALTPPDLATGSLAAALGRLAATTQERSGLAVDLRVVGTPTPAPTPHEVALLRTAQSALANVEQHADARHATLTLTYMDGGLALDVVDDGRGFSPDDARASDPDGGFGLAAMRARVQELGGTCSVESVPGAGTALGVSLPHVAPGAAG